MASDYFKNLTSKDREQAREEGKRKKQEIIAKAISDGATIHYNSMSITDEERETLIQMDYMDQTATVYTSIQRDMTKLIARGWKIISITYKRSSIDPKDNTAGIIEMGFIGPIKKIGFGSCNKDEE
jgi:hypothetical protein